METKYSFGLTNSAQFVNNIIVQKEEVNRVTPFNDNMGININFYKAYNFDYIKPVDSNFNFKIAAKYLEIPLYDKFKLPSYVGGNVLSSEYYESINKTDGILHTETYKLQLTFDSIFINSTNHTFATGYVCTVNGKQYELKQLQSGSATLPTYGVEIPIELDNSYTIDIHLENSFFLTSYAKETIKIDRTFIDEYKMSIFSEGTGGSYFVLRYLVKDQYKPNIAS